MSDRVCGTCGMRFEYPYLLERHINGKRKCKPIDNSRSNFHCQYCNNNYASKYSINNHQKICKAKKEAEVQVQNGIQNEDIQENNNENNKINTSDLLKIITKNQDLIKNNNSSNIQDIINQNAKLINILNKLV
jgi:hypothetical protein